jgi:hypothetical protein
MSDEKLDKVKLRVAEYVDYDSECGKDFAYCFDKIESQQKEIKRLKIENDKLKEDKNFFLDAYVEKIMNEDKP